jgi:hypothetical protein
METDKEQSWCERIFDALSVVEAGPGCGVDLDGEPEWVGNVLKQLVHQATPAVSLKPDKITPRWLGRLLGQQRANCAAIEARTMNATPEQMAQAEAAVEQLEKSKDKPEIASLLQAFELAGNAMVSTEPLMDQVAKITLDALKMAWEQPDPLERLAFFQGIAEGLSKPGVPARFTDATSIYNRLFVHRQDIAKLKSVRELREFLLRCGLSEQALGDPKRLEKLCERIGLSFAGRGRPKHTK